MITSPGIGSGLDIESLVTQLVTLEGQSSIDRFARREAGFQAELSGLGSFRAAIDSMHSAIEPLTDLNEFGARIASSSDEEIFTVSANNTVVVGEYDIEVVSLAAVHKLSSGAHVDATTIVGTGTIEISLGPDGDGGGSMTINMLDEENASLKDIRDAINASESNPGVVASIVNADDGAHLVLTGTKTGADRVITTTVTGGTGELATFFGTLTEQQAAADADITFDSFPYKSASNTVKDVVDGITINLQSADPGTTATLSVALDVDGARDLVEDFVDAYNSLLDTTNELTRYNPETREAGFLQGRSIVPSLMERLSKEFNTTVLGPLNSLRDLGMSIALDGKIELNDTTLDEILSSDFNNVGNLFARKTDGAAVRIDALLNEYLKADGLLDVRTDGLESSIGIINEGRESLDRHLVAVEARLRTQFLALDQLVSELNGTSGFLATQLSNMVSPTALLGR